MTAAWRRPMLWLAVLIAAVLAAPYALTYLGPRLCGWQPIEDGAEVILVRPREREVPGYWIPSGLEPGEPWTPDESKEPDILVERDEVFTAEPLDALRIADAEWLQVGSVAPADDEEGARLGTQGGVAVRRDQVAPMPIWALGLRYTSRGRKAGPVELVPAITRSSYWADAAEYRTSVGTVISLIKFGTHTVYLTQDDGTTRTLLARPYNFQLPYVTDSMLMIPRVRTVMRGGRPPDVLAFMPPLGMVCWRWNGEAYAPALPDGGQALMLIWLWMQGAAIWLEIAFAVGLLALGVAFRNVLFRYTPVGCALGVVWFLIAFAAMMSGVQITETWNLGVP